MLMRNSSVLVESGRGSIRRGHLALVGGLILLTLMFAGTQANARPVEFRFSGGSWSHGYHAGWHRYWGGPSIGFYYAPAPAYVVVGYAAPSYYSGPDFWYSNPSFGLSLNFGGGGHYGGYAHGGYYPGRGVHYSGGGFHGGSAPIHGGASFGNGFHGHEEAFGRGSFGGEHRR